MIQSIRGSVLNLCFVGQISDSVIRQDRAILLGYVALPNLQNNLTHNQNLIRTASYF